MTAHNLVTLHRAGQITREQMLVRLANLVYATGVFDRKLPYTPGQDVEMQEMIEAGELTPEERDQVLATVYAFEQQHTAEPLDHLL